MEESWTYQADAWRKDGNRLVPVKEYRDERMRELDELTKRKPPKVMVSGEGDGSGTCDICHSAPARSNGKCQRCYQREYYRAKRSASL